MKRIASIILSVIFALHILVSSQMLSALAADETYKTWKQTDARWADVSTGGNDTVGLSGCLITACAILMVQSGAEPNDEELFNPGILAERLLNDEYLSNGAMVKGLPKSYSPDFYYALNDSKKVLEDDYDLICRKIESWMNSGFYVIVGVKWNGSANCHWVAVDYCRDGEVFIMDPGYRNVNCLRHYDGGISGIKLIRANRVYGLEEVMPVLAVSSGAAGELCEFTWNEFDGAVLYILQITDADGNEILTESELTECSYSVALPHGDYAATLTANCGDNNDVAGEEVTFSVEFGPSEPKAVTEYDGHIYALYENKEYFDHAEAVCEQMGGHLAVISSEEERAAVNSLLADASGTEYWLGASDAETESTWKWVNGESFDYALYQSPWALNEPNNDCGEEHYLTVDVNGEWHDARSMAAYSNGFTLEVEPLTAAATAEYNGSTYQRFDVSLNWTEANAYCRMMGGYLTAIGDAGEDAFLQSLIAEGEQEQYWIGLRDAAWSNGESLSYNPLEDAEHPESCGTVESGSGQWGTDENYSTVLHGFVCEIPASEVMPAMGRPEETTSQRGDVNEDGRITVSDVILTARIAAEDQTVRVSEQGLINADADGMNGITVDDTNFLLKVIAMTDGK